MPASPQLRKPAYAVTSVDNALRLLQMLRDLGEVRSKEAAEELGISPSTVHRLMSMLVYRGFAVQNEARVYLPGPSIGIPPAASDGARRLQNLVRPYLSRLRDEAQESAYFMVLTGRVVRFLLTAESSYPTHAGDRHGFVIPAHTSAGGKAILSVMSRKDLDEMYNGPDARDGVELSDAELDALLKDLMTVRARGYAVSVEEVERGIVTVSAPLRHAWVRPLSAISLSGPVARREALTHERTVSMLLAARDAIESALLRSADASSA